MSEQELVHLRPNDSDKTYCGIPLSEAGAEAFDLETFWKRPCIACLRAKSDGVFTIYAGQPQEPARV